MKTLKIALIVDHPLRDLSGLVLIARKLAEQGAKVFLVPMYAQDREIFTLQPDFVLLNYLRKNNENFVRKLLKAGIQYGILDTEGGFYGDMKGYSDILSYDAELYANLRCNLIWGQKMMDFWQKDFPHRHPLFLTGLPRFDFYSPAFRNLQFGSLPKKYQSSPLLLINTKVAIANPLFVNLETEISIYKKLGFSDEKIQHYLDLGKVAIEDTVALTKKLSLDFPQAQVVVRPHPHENHKTYEAALQDSKATNTSVHREGSVTPWILGSQVVIHRHCTTAIEAALADKTAIAPQWVRTSAFAPDAEDVSFQPRTPEEMNELITTSFKSGPLPKSPEQRKALDRIIGDWLYQMDGNSHVRAANAILESINSKQSIDRTKASDFIFDTFSAHAGLKGKAYHFLNQAGRLAPEALWALEKGRLAKWKSTQKFFTPEDALQWSASLDRKENHKFQIDWAQKHKEYQEKYPGFAVMVSPS